MDLFLLTLLEAERLVEEIRVSDGRTGSVDIGRDQNALLVVRRCRDAMQTDAAVWSEIGSRVHDRPDGQP